MQTTIERGLTAKSVFGFDELHDFQNLVLDAIDAGRDCLAVSPTGSGKTLCFGLPAALERARPATIRRVVLVVSPLIALMRDQATRLEARGLQCAVFDRLQSMDDRSGQWQKIESGTATLAFISPERLANATFRERLAATREVFLVAVDEAHCTSQWGFNFRPEYRQIGAFMESFPGAVRLALTATATPGVRADMIRNLGLRAPQIFVNKTARENITHAVEQVASFKDQLPRTLDAIERRVTAGSTLVYAPTRKIADTLHSALRRRDVRSGLYHAGLDGASRSRQQDDFLARRVGCMIATSAFGMGIDKRDIRTVIHAGLPQNLEQYVQETGRAGRDGLPAAAIMVFHPRDFHTNRFMIEVQFPDTALARGVFDCCADEFGKSGFHGAAYGLSRDFLIASCASRNPSAKARDVEAALDYATRENLLQQMTSEAPGSTGTEVVLLPGTTLNDPENFWRQYEYRRAEAFYKLEKMRLFAQTAARSIPRAMGQLNAYFESCFTDAVPGDVSHDARSRH